MMYHLFHNSMWKVVRIAKTSDCKTLLILKWPPLYLKTFKFAYSPEMFVITLPQKSIRAVNKSSTVLGNFLKKYLRYRSFIYLIGKP